jgi:phosphotransferase system HPr (HPr) family protein
VELVETLEITNKTGLHARPSTEFVRLAQRFASEVTVGVPNGPEVDGKSIIAMLSLGVAPGGRIVVRVRGADAEPAMAALVALVRADFRGM